MKALLADRADERALLLDAEERHVPIAIAVHCLGLALHQSHEVDRPGGRHVRELMRQRAIAVVRVVHPQGAAARTERTRLRHCKSRRRHPHRGRSTQPVSRKARRRRRTLPGERIAGIVADRSRRIAARTHDETIVEQHIGPRSRGQQAKRRRERSRPHNRHKSHHRQSFRTYGASLIFSAPVCQFQSPVEITHFIFKTARHTSKSSVERRRLS